MKIHCTETKLICSKCGNKQNIFRKSSKTKKYGHIKTIWCYKCKDRVEHIEIRNEEVEGMEE